MRASQPPRHQLAAVDCRTTPTAPPAPRSPPRPLRSREGQPPFGPGHSKHPGLSGLLPRRRGRRSSRQRPAPRHDVAGVPRVHLSRPPPATAWPKASPPSAPAPLPPRPRPPRRIRWPAQARRKRSSRADDPKARGPAAQSSPNSCLRLAMNSFSCSSTPGSMPGSGYSASTCFQRSAATTSAVRAPNRFQRSKFSVDEIHGR